VVSAGAKSVLDLGKTLEVLEALAVLVVGVGSTDFPSFYSRESGHLLEHRIDTPEAGAQLMRVRFEELKQGGILFALPPPTSAALPREEVERHIEVALREAEREKIRGKAVTPYLLAKLGALTQNKTLGTNLELITHNASFAASLAVAYGEG
jgi:pseudouridylate synthase